MALYAIGDLHLCLGAPKPMDIFGGAWVGYMEKLRQGLSCITEDDTTVLLGDLSWALDMAGAKDDFDFISQIPGRKIILKGNHDYWWCTAKKFGEFCEKNGFADMNLLNNNHYEYENIAICGTRGWFYEEARCGKEDEKVFLRELIRLEASLKSAGDREKLVFLHYPPIFAENRAQQILDLLQEFDVKECYFGHLHGYAAAAAWQGESDGIRFRLTSADALKFTPLRIR
jgi:predicted phosphohydrolase